MKFDAIDALPMSDLFIAKRIQEDSVMQWKLFDAYKVNKGYDIEIGENGIIATNSANELNIIGANFSSMRRQNLKGAIVRSIFGNENEYTSTLFVSIFQVTCGLVVN